MSRKALAQVSLIAVVAGCMLAGSTAGCSSASHPTEPGERIGSVGEHLTSSAGLQLEVLTNSCGANQVQDFLQITNTGTTSVPLSQITVKVWADDTSGQSLVGQIDTGGCLTNASGCFHNVSGVTVAAKSFSPACGPDPTNQANWEVTISNTDSTSIAPGQTWTGDEVALHLGNFGSFTPGTADWYSPCLKGSSYAFDTHYAVFVGGNLVTASPGVPPSCRAAQGVQPLAGEVLPGLGTTYPLVGPLASSTLVSLSIGLPLVNPPGQQTLQSFIQNVSNPQSPSYRQYMTPTLFASSYGPSVQDYTTLQQFVAANGMTVQGTHTSRAELEVSGTAAAIESAFNVTLNVYKRPNGTTFYAATNTPSYTLPALTNPILYVAGFDDFAQPTPASGTSPRDCPAGSQAYFGGDMRTLYLTGCGNTVCSANGFGLNTTVAIVESDQYNPTSVQDYANGSVGVTNLGPGLAPELCTTTTSLTHNVSQVCVGTLCTNGAAGPFSPGLMTVTSSQLEAEAELGIEMVLAMAPQATVIVYEQPTEGGVLPLSDNLFAQMAEVVPSDSGATGASAKLPPQVVVNTWTWTTPLVDASLLQTFQQYAAQGQSFFQAAGDLGSYNVTGSVVATVPHPINDTPFMTVVGGTMFTGLSSADALQDNESPWNDPTERTAANGCLPTPTTTAVASGLCASATGGGVCPGVPIPGYQVGLGASLSPANTTQRMIPDVSMIADNIVSVTGVTPAITCSQGTSASAALWGGFAAIANELSAGSGSPGAVGFANPELYFLATSVSSNSYFNDITSGGNNYTSTTGAYQAGTGYDMASGLGSPLGNSCNLATSLPTQSCMSGTSVTALVQGRSVTAYVPAGSYGETAPGWYVVPLEVPPTSAAPITYGNQPATGTLVTPTPPTADSTLGGIINTCAGNSLTGMVVCTSNGTTVYAINTTTGVTTTLPPDGASVGAFEQFSGGSCETCNVTIDPIHNVAYLSVATTTTAGSVAAIQPLTLSGTLGTSSFGTLIPTGQQATSEDIVVDPQRGLILSPIEGAEETSSNTGDYQIIQLNVGSDGGPQVFNLTNPSGGEAVPTASFGGFDSAAEDCTTGIGLASDEFTGDIFLVNLSSPTLTAATSTAVGTWVPSSTDFFPLTEFNALSSPDGPEAGASTIVVAPGHIAVVGGEFGGNTFAVVQLPSSASGSLQPTGYVVAQLPDTPDNNPWSFGHDPHTVTAYQSPNNGKSYAVFEDDFGDTRTYLAVVDLEALLALLPSTSAAASSRLTETNSGGNGWTVSNPVLQAVGGSNNDSCTATSSSTGANPAGCFVRFTANALPADP